MRRKFYRSVCTALPSLFLPLLPQAFVRRTRPAGGFDDGEGDDDDDVAYDDAEVTSSATPGAAGAASAAASAVLSSTDDDLLGISFGGGGGGGGAATAAVPAYAPAAPPPAAGGGGIDDLFGDAFGSAPAPAPAAPAVPSYPVLGEKEGLVVRGGFTRGGGGLPVLDLVISNTAGSTPVTAMALKCVGEEGAVLVWSMSHAASLRLRCRFNVNVLGLSPAAMTVTFASIAP
jgi:hypothetical protein